MKMPQNKTNPYKVKRAGTRDAVESAIDLSKRDKSSTWAQIQRTSPKATRWDTTQSGSDNIQRT